MNIGKNTHLKEMTINLKGCTHVVGNDFCKFVLNRSIKKLRLIGCGRTDYDNFPLLVPFFRNNQAFESLVVAWCYGFGAIANFLRAKHLHALVAALRKFNSMKEFKFHVIGS